MIMDASGGDTAALVALKPVAYAKSRLGTLPDPLRRRLAWTMAVDTLRALGAAVDAVLVVSDQPALTSRLARAGVRARVVGDAGAVGLNEALSRGAALLQAGGHRSVLACVGDLPALRPDSVRAVLAAAPERGRAFLADASGFGTTMLITGGAPLDPRFSGPSAAAHAASGAVDLDQSRLPGPVPDARQDVDSEVDLGPAALLGLGAATQALMDPQTGRLATFTVITTTQHTDDRGRAVALTAAGYRVRLPAEALADGLRRLRPGQRLHAVQADGVVLSAWM
ncbi:2-phospho-L-lactate guanylyltransferase [uncultured Friedmanniella sp.]|uniref:2-phospho-L-lactate guanylyltransferase n=1 Tax=uncultured Friedmanniella sp. TaxID=335381 RepID=UPI0035CCA7E0